MCDPGWKRIAAQSLADGQPGPLTLEEFGTLYRNVRSALEARQPTWVEQYTECTPVEIVAQLACRYLYES